MALPTTGITTTLVKNTIGKSSNNIGTLVASSVTGGTGGYAFNIAENGGTNGYLIDNAKPYYNIFSANSPSTWVNNAGVITCKLKNNGGDATKNYGFSLGDFRGYNHSAVPVSYSCDAVWFQQGNYTQFNGTINLGEYNWSTVMPEQYGIKPVVNIYNSTGLVLRGTMYAGEAYSSSNNTYYFGGQVADSTNLSYICKLGFVSLKADGTPGTIGYNFQPSGWFNPQKTVAATTMLPSDKPTEKYLTVTTPVEIPITNVTINVAADSTNVYYSRFTAGFKCYDYLDLTDNTRTIKIKVSNLITGETLFENLNYGTHIIRATNNISILCPVYYTEMNLVYQVELY